MLRVPRVCRHTGRALISGRSYRQLCTEDRRINIPEMKVESRIEKQFDDMWKALDSKGYYTSSNFLGMDVCAKMRAESELLFQRGKFFQSQSLTSTGRHFDKPGVFACELDGSSLDEWEAAPHILAYTREVILSLPRMLNAKRPSLSMSSQLYGTKLAVANDKGSKYPKHVDNSGSAGTGDLRKLTFIYYMNPGWDDSNGGALRVWEEEGARDYVDTYPEGDRIFTFWSDVCIHEVLANEDENFPRYALTLWLVTEDENQITGSGGAQSGVHV